VTGHEIAADEMHEAFVPRARSYIASAILDGEAVIYDEESGSVHLLNPTATMLWQCFDGTGTLGDLIADICEAFHLDESTARRDVLEVARSIGSLGLLVGVQRVEESEEEANGKSLAQHD
jgi:PqqD family protein of HPr-rel-A system